MVLKSTPSASLKHHCESKALKKSKNGANQDQFKMSESLGFLIAHFATLLAINTNLLFFFFFVCFFGRIVKFPTRVWQ